VSHIDGAIGISDIYHALLSAIGDANTDSAEEGEPVTGLGLGWPVLGGQVSSLRAESSLAVGGLGDVQRLLDEIERGILGDIQYVECHACAQGCCGGSLNVSDPYVTRSTILSLTARFGNTACQDREKTRQLYRRNYFSLPGKIPSRPFAPLDKDISRAIEKRKCIQGTYAALPQIDCGACGAPTCLSFAEDVVLGRAPLQDCVVLAAKEARAAARVSSGPPSNPEVVTV
jgi:hypothetical protein